MFIILWLAFMGMFFYDLRSYLFDYQVGREDFSSMGALAYAIHAQEPINHIGIILSLAVALLDALSSRRNPFKLSHLFGKKCLTGK